MVAAANVGYLIVFILMPIAFIVLERRAGGPSRVMTSLAMGLSAFNAWLLIAGGIQWGGEVMLTGVVVIALIVPISAVRRVQDRRRGCSDLPPFPAGEPHDVPG